MKTGYDFSMLGVMAVDDNPHVLQILRTLLTTMKVYEARCFESAVDALQALDGWLPDVIITDYQMEPLNGIEFAKHVRAAAGLCRFAPIVLLTGHANAKLVAAARDSGADCTLTKPVTLQSLYKTFLRLRDGEREFVQTSRYFGPDRRRKSKAFTGPDRRAR